MKTQREVNVDITQGLYQIRNITLQENPIKSIYWKTHPIARECLAYPYLTHCKIIAKYKN